VNRTLLTFSIFCFCLAFDFPAKAQKSIPTKASISFQLDLDSAAAQSQFHLYLKGDESALSELVQSLGGKVKYRYKNYSAVVVSKEMVESLKNSTEVEAIHYEGEKGTVLLSQSLLQSNVLPVHNGTNGLPDGYKGEDVIVGIIDAGLDLNHPDLRDANNKTRVLEYWDQTLSYSVTYTPSYGYGRVYDSAAINAGLCPSQDQASFYGHGTNTTGIVASNGLATGDFVGAAPKADIIVVSSNFSAFGWTSTVADAVDFIFARAEFYGKPCVINASLGTYLGSHDGLDFAAQLIDEDITAEHGRAMVCAAGNSGNFNPYHLGYLSTGDTSFTWFKLPNNASVGNGSIFMEIYGDVGTFENLYFSVSADRTNPNYQFRGVSTFISVSSVLNVQLYDTLFSESGNYLGAIQYYADSANGAYRLQLYINNIDSIAYNYGLQVAGVGRFDLWSGTQISGRDMVYNNLPSTVVFPRIAKYRLPDLNQSIVSSWACSDKVITVGNYTNRTSYTDVDQNQVVLSNLTQGAIAANSSLGPSRRGIQKPELTAPGDNTMTAGAAFQIASLLANPSQRNRVAIGGMHNRAGGTSSASPMVAGISALYFEKCPGKNWEDLKLALTQNTTVDAFTTNLPNNQWGFGKVNALKALKSSTPNPALLANGNEFCDGELFQISLATNFDSILWNNGLLSASITAIQSGLYYATVIDADGCIGNSDSLAVFKRANPIKPALNISADSISACINDEVLLEIADTYGSYTWSSGEHTNGIQVSEPGSYYCEVSNIYNCKNWSDTIAVDFYPGSPNPTINFKADGKLHAFADSSLVTAYQWYLNNLALNDSDSNMIEPNGAGVYQVSYTDIYGCEYFSDALTVYALGLDENPANSQLLVYPNPMNDFVTVAAHNQISDLKLYDQLGQLIFQCSPQKLQESINVSQLPNGMYFLQISMGNSIETKRLIK
jgi:hypothetical protein